MTRTQYNEDIMFDRLKKRQNLNKYKRICLNGKSLFQTFSCLNGKSLFQTFRSANKYEMRHHWKIANKKLWSERAKQLKKRCAMYVFNKIYGCWILEAQKLPNETITHIIKYL